MRKRYLGSGKILMRDVDSRETQSDIETGLSMRMRN
jgi:hypothetical protein